MRQRRFGLAVAVVAAAQVAAGCGAVGDLVSRGSGAPKVAAVGVLVPLSGQQAAAGAGVREAIRLAVRDAAGVPGWTVEVVAMDDGGRPRSAVEAARELVDDDRVVGIVGGLSRPVVRAVQPVAEAAETTLLSPADIDERHSRGADPAAPLRPYSTYFRAAVGGISQGQAAAAYVARTVGTSTGAAEQAAVAEDPAPSAKEQADTRPVVATLHDGSAGGAVAVDDFGAEAAARGMRVIPLRLASQSQASQSQEVQQAVGRARRAGALAVYTGSGARVAAAIAKAMHRRGWDVPLVGTDAMRTEEFVRSAGGAATRAVATTPADVEPTVGRDGDLTARMSKATSAAGPGPFGAAAYDAATAVVQALSRCLPAAGSARAARAGCVAEMSQTSFTGLTGDFRFSEFGERVGESPGLWRVKGSEWIAIG